MPPSVTIVIPTYNRGTVLRRAIDSVLAQTHRDLSVLVVDDGSTDDTPALLLSYENDGRLTWVRHDTNRGVTAAKNTGLSRLPADGAYVGILDSDDVLLPCAIATLVRVFEETPDAYSQVLGWHRDRVTGELRGSIPGAAGRITFSDALHGRFAGDFWHLARRDLLGDLRFDERASGGEGAVWWRLLKSRPAWVVPDVVGLVDTSGDDRVSGWDGTAGDALRRMRSYQATIAAVGEDLRAEAPRRYGEMLASLARWAALGGDRDRARRAARMAARFSPGSRTVLLMLAVQLPRGLLVALSSARGWVRRGSHVRSAGARDRRGGR